MFGENSRLIFGLTSLSSPPSLSSDGRRFRRGMASMVSASERLSSSSLRRVEPSPSETAPVDEKGGSSLIEKEVVGDASFSVRDEVETQLTPELSR